MKVSKWAKNKKNPCVVKCLKSFKTLWIYEQCHVLPWWISSSVEERILFTERRSWRMEDRGEARGPDPLCNRGDAKWLMVWRGHLRPAHLDNELRCNPKLRWTAVYPSRSPSLSLSHQSPLSPQTSPLSLIPSLFTLLKLIYSTPLFSQWWNVTTYIYSSIIGISWC